MTDNLEVKKLVEEAGKTMKFLQDEVYSAKQVDVCLEATQKKAEEHYTKTREEMDNLKKYNEKLEKEMEVIKAVANKPSFSVEEKSAKNDMELKNAYFKEYLAKGSDISLKALSVGSDTDGGYTLPQQSLEMIQARIFETSDVERFARVVNTNSSTYEYLIQYDQAEVEYMSETLAPISTDTPHIGKGVIPIHNYVSRPLATQNILEDSAVNIESWLINYVARDIGLKQNTDFVLGNGVNKPSGLLNPLNLGSTKVLTDPSVYSSTKVEVYKSGSATAFTADNLLSLVGKLKKQYRKNIFCNRETEIAIAKLQDGSNGFIFNFPQSGTISVRGMNVEVFEDMPAISDGLNPIIVGDLSQAYLIVKRRGIIVERDKVTSFPYVKFNTTARVGGGVVVPDAIKILKTAV
jgi:HK97 family phage major capsid protein